PAAAGEAAKPAVAPAPTVRVRTETLDRFLSTVGEVILGTSQLRSTGLPLEQSAEVAAGLDHVERKVSDLQRRALDLRTTPLLRAVEPLPRTARQVAEGEGKRVEVQLVGAELELDRSILDRIGDPLLHLVRNAVSHGIESPEDRRRAGKSEVGTLVVEARRHRDSIHIEVRDDGRGLDLASVLERAVQAGLVHPDLAEDLPPEEIAELVFRPGLSTAESVSDVSGRGVGMDAVRATIESLGGSVELRSRPGLGTATTLVVPITAAVQRVLLVALGQETAALPIAKVERILEVPADEIEGSGAEAFALIDDEPVLVLELASVLRMEGGERPEFVPVALAEVRGERVGLLVDRFVGQQEFYVKPVPELLSGVRALSGLTLLGDGDPVFLLDLNHLV
ncbi:MAG: chemotaxis protein CheW, partial [Proteobacteria bacterium]|nr:chemotaxis protein CheW [Pseudomonadota bacterium]